MNNLNATLAACIVMICVGLALANPGTSVILDLIIGALLFFGVMRPAWITWYNWLNKTN